MTIRASLVVVAIAVLGAACDRPRRSDPATPAVASQEDAVPASFDHAAAYRDLLARLNIADPGDRAVAFEDLTAGAVRCFALREGDGYRLKACVTPTGVVRDGAASGDDWPGLLAAAPDAATAARWIAWLETNDAPGVHAPRIPNPIAVLTPATAADHGYEPAHQAKIRAPELKRDAGGAVLTAWFHRPGVRVPVRWIVRARPDGTQIEQASALEVR